ncbi:MAG: SGNH/GDSL hydrolase family protein [Candidatus Saccharimonadales bacterium]|jgi:lysophospholipase L1-like esterase
MFKSRWAFGLCLGGALSVTAVLLLSVLVLTSSADNPSGWLNNSLLHLQGETSLSFIPYSLNGNIDCQQTYETYCDIPTAYGMASSNGRVLLNGTTRYYPVYSYLDNQQYFQAIPGSNTVLTYTLEPPYGAYYYFNRNFNSSIDFNRYFNGVDWEYKYDINRPPDGKLADQSGHLLAVDYDSMSFSSNGQWMVASEPNGALLRVNLNTFEVTPFAVGFDYTIGLDPTLQTAITNDGRYAVVASKNFYFFKIYDLSTCGPVPFHITGPVACQSRDLKSFMEDQVAGFTRASNIRFIDDDTLGLYASAVLDAMQTTSKYILSTAGGGLHQLDYLTLGDSYISGEGAFNYLAGTDTSDNKCHISVISYPYLLGYNLGYDSYRSVACSGATTNDINNSRADYMGQARPKIKQGSRTKDQLAAILSSFLPGYIYQNSFIARYQPKIITISAGGNDIGFSSILKDCVMPGTCYNTYEDRLELVRQINSSVFPKLVDTYQRAKNAGAPDARIYVIGYPQIVKPSGDCADNVHLDAQEIDFAARLISYLDSVVQTAANRAGVIYVDTQHALDGHMLCETNSYSVAVNGLTAGNDRPSSLGGPIGDESYHPNYLGHQLLAQAVVAATQNLNQPMPTANPSAMPPDESGLAILNISKSNRAINVAQYDPDISDDTFYKGTLTSVTINGLSHSLQPLSELTAVIHSEPVALGNFTTDSMGNLSAQITISDGVSAGYHSLHFYGTDITGQPVDIYKTVYVADVSSNLNDNNAESNRTESSTPAQSQTTGQSSTSTPMVLASGTSKTAGHSITNTAADQDLRVPDIYVIGFSIAMTTTVVLAYAARD